MSANRQPPELSQRGSPGVGVRHRGSPDASGLGRVGGVAGELMTGNDWALSGIIAALLARGCCGDRVRGTDRFPELPPALQRRRTPPRRGETGWDVAGAMRNGGRTRAGRVSSRPEWTLGQLVIEGTTQRKPSQDRTVMAAAPQSFTIILQSQQAGRATIACGWASRNPSIQRARQYGITISVISGRF